MSQERHPSSRDLNRSLRITSGLDLEKEATVSQPTPPADLVQVLIDGLSSQTTRPVLDSWINFLTECLPLLSPVIFQILLQLVECFCKQIQLTFDTLKGQFREPDLVSATPEMSLVALLN